MEGHRSHIVNRSRPARGIWIIERSALLGAGLVVIGVIVVGVVTLWTIVKPVAMAIVAMGALIRAATVMRDRKSLV